MIANDNFIKRSKRRLESSRKGSSDPLIQDTLNHDHLHIISTNDVKCIGSIRKHIEHKRPKFINIEMKKPKHLAIIVPYRDRETHLQTFIPHMTNHLEQQALKATILLVEQSPQQSFNRGFLKNIGAHWAQQQGCDFLCFHDVDLLPIDVEYHKMPNHPYRPFSKLDRKDNAYIGNCQGDVFNHLCFGGIACFPTNVFFNIGGYNNQYWGWGCEDDDLLMRTFMHGQIPLIHKTGSITNLPHPHAMYVESRFFPRYNGYSKKRLLLRNRKQFRRMKRGLLNKISDLHNITDQHYATPYHKDGYQHIIANISPS